MKRGELVALHNQGRCKEEVSSMGRLSKEREKIVEENDNIKQTIKETRE